MRIETAAAALAFALAGATCSTTLPDPCDRVYSEAGTLVQCSRRADTAHWAASLPLVLADLEMKLPGVSSVAATHEVRVLDVRFDYPHGGMYFGYHGDDAVEIYIREGDNVEARYSALAHEWAHAWEHRVRGVSYDEWYSSPTHFVEQSLIDDALQHVRDMGVEWCQPI